MVFASEPQPPVDSPGLLSATRRYRVLVAALTVAGVVLAALFTIVQPSTPAAEARMTLVDPRGTAVLSGGGSQQLDATRYVADRMEVASSSTALGIAAKAMGKGVTAGELRDACSVSAVPESTTLVLSCSLSSASDSTRAVTELAAAYRSVTKDDLASKAAATTSAIERERVALLDRIAKAGAEEDDPDVRAATLESATSRLAALDQRESAIATSLSLFGDGVDFFDPARTVEGSGLIAQLVRNAFVGGALGFIIALVIASPRANEPKTITLAGGRGRAPARRPISSRTMSVDRARANTAREATCSRTSRNSDEGGTSRRSTTPSSTNPGSTRDACAMLTPASLAMVRRLSSAVVSANTASTRPWAPGTMASIGRTKSTVASYLTTKQIWNDCSVSDV